MRYEFIQMKPDGKTLLKVLAAFSAKNDGQAWAQANRLYEQLPSINLTTPYMCRQKGTARIVEGPPELSED